MNAPSMLLETVEHVPQYSLEACPKIHQLAVLVHLLQVHMDVLVPFVDRPPGDLINELSSLATRREIAWDPAQNDPALAWRIIRQPDDWEGLVDEVYNRLDRVSWGQRLHVCCREHPCLRKSVCSLAGLLCCAMCVLTLISGVVMLGCYGNPK